jgi:hypothetical protein
MDKLLMLDMTQLSFGGGGKSKSSSPPGINLPSYTPSKYDAPSAENISNFYTPRIQGKQTGFEKGDLDLMRQDAQDQSTRAMNSLIKQQMAGARIPGGLSTGGQQAIRERAMRTGLESRSQAIRDIGIKNAVLKHQDQWNAASGLQGFLNSERAEAQNIWAGNRANAMAQWQSDMTGWQASQQEEPNMWGSLAGQAAGMFGPSMMKNLLPLAGSVAGQWFGGPIGGNIRANLGSSLAGGGASRTGGSYYKGNGFNIGSILGGGR